MNSFRICRTGLYPLTGMESTKTKKESRPQLNLSRPKSPEDVQNSSQGSEEEELKEVRHVMPYVDCFRLHFHIPCTIYFPAKVSSRRLFIPQVGRWGVVSINVTLVLWNSSFADNFLLARYSCSII